MKRFTILAVALLFISFAATTASADEIRSAVASVFVTVDPNVAIFSATPIVDLGSIQTGSFPAVLTWRVDANQEAVSFFLEASALYKGDDPTNEEVAPIPLNMAFPATIKPALGNEINSGDNKAAWIGTGVPIGDYPTSLTETVRYESSQNGHFSQEVMTTIWYTQPDAEKPTGQYSGKIRMTVLL